MQQKKPDTTFFDGMQSTFQQMMGSFPVGMQTMIDMQRKNMQAMAEANARTLEGWQAIARRQGEMASQFLQDNSALARDAFAEGAPQEKIALQADLMKGVYERSLANGKELADMAASCTKEAAELIQKRIIASMNEIKASAVQE